MSYITPAQFRYGMQQAKDYTDNAVQNSGGGSGSGGGGFNEGYIVGTTPFAGDWLSGTEGGTAITPKSGEVRVVMTEGEYSRMLYKYDGTKWVPVGAKVNLLPYMSDIIHDVGNVNAVPPGASPATVEACRFRPSEKTTKITIKCNIVPSSGGGGGNMSYGVENEDVKTRTSSGDINETFSLQEGTKENDFVITLVAQSAYPVLDQNITKLSNCVVIESNEKYEYTHNLTTKSIFNNEAHESQAGLVPAIPDEVGESGVLLSDGVWHTKERAAEILDELPITKEEIAQAFNEAYGATKPSNNVYSLEEQVIGTWIDGKPLYRKTIELDNTCFVSNSGKNVAHGISNLDNVIFKYGFFYRRVNGIKTRQTIPQSYYGSLEWNLDIQDINDTNMTIQTGSGWENQIEYGAVTLEYTKTTDATS